MVNNYNNIQQNKHLSQLKSLNTKKTMTYVDGNPGSQAWD